MVQIKILIIQLSFSVANQKIKVQRVLKKGHFKNVQNRKPKIFFIKRVVKKTIVTIML
jgi:hypothetical protein